MVMSSWGLERYRAALDLHLSTSGIAREEDGGIDWLWSVIEETVGLFINNIHEFRQRGGQVFHGEQRILLLEMPMTSLVGLFMGPERTECSGVLIVYDYWKQLVITAYSCAATSRFRQPDEDDGWISSWIQPSYFNGPFKGQTNI